MKVITVTIYPTPCDVIRYEYNIDKEELVATRGDKQEPDKYDRTVKEGYTLHQFLHMLLRDCQEVDVYEQVATNVYSL